MKDLCACGRSKDTRARVCTSCRTCECGSRLTHWSYKKCARCRAVPDERECIVCLESKPISEFRFNGKSSRTCNVCNIDKLKTWSNSLDPVKLNLRRKALRLGMDPDVILQHFADHHGLCDLCGRLPGEVVKGRKALCIDHDHQTGKFRGLLCGNCNLALGMLHDDADLLRRAADYVSR